MVVHRWWEWFVGLPDWQLTAVAVVAVVLFFVLNRVATNLLLRRTEHTTVRILIEGLYLPVVTTGLVVAVVLVAGMIETADLRALVRASAVTVLVIVWAYGLIRLGNRLAHSRDRQRLKFGPVIANIFTIFVLIAALFATLGVWGVDLTPLLASAGILGIVVGYAARDTISNLTAGIALYFDRTFVVGDFIALPDGERGTVVDISIRSTTILTLDNVMVTVPNAEFNRQRVSNESAPQRHLRLRVDVNVAYGSDLETAERALLQAAEDVDVLMDDPEPRVRYRAFGDSAIAAQVLCYVGHPSRRIEAVDELLRRVDARFEEHGVKIPFPQREVTFFEAGNTVRVDDARDVEDTGDGPD